MEGVTKSTQVDLEIPFLEIRKIKEMKSTSFTESLVISTVSFLILVSSSFDIYSRVKDTQETGFRSRQGKNNLQRKKHNG